MDRVRVLVTGGAGFIGSHLVERLVVDGNEVTVIDNFSTGRLENLVHIGDKTALRIIEADITHLQEHAHCFKDIDWVFHLAAIADIVPSIKKPLMYHQSNVSGTVNVLEASKKANVKRFIYASSSSCYGIPDEYPTPEIAPIRPQYPYALTKYLGEQYVMHWGKVYGIPSVALRLFNVFGPRSRTSGTYGAVFGVFLAQKLAKKPFTVVGDGNQTRDFTFVTDIVESMIRAAKSDLSDTIMNVGSDNSYSINYLISLLGGDVVYIPKRPGEPECTLADIGKIQRLLDWYPQTSFEQGVAMMIDCIDYWNVAPVWTPSSIEDATLEWFQCLGKN